MSREEECIIDPAATGRCMRGTIRCSRHPFVPPGFAPKSSSPMPGEALDPRIPTGAGEIGTMANGSVTVAPKPAREEIDRPGMVCHVCMRPIDPTVGYQVDAPGVRRHPECTAIAIGDEVVIRGRIVERDADDGTLRVQYAASGSDRFAMWFRPDQVQRAAEFTRKADS